MSNFQFFVSDYGDIKSDVNTPSWLQYYLGEVDLSVEFRYWAYLLGGTDGTCPEQRYGVSLRGKKA